MRVAQSIIEERRRILSGMLAEHRYLPISEICSRFSISEATARRDLCALADSKQIQRTHGGAVAFFSHRFPSFQQRLSLQNEDKRQLAQRTLRFLQVGNTVFLDGGTTPYLVAVELKKKPIHPLTVITPNLPAAELLAPVPGIEVHLTGGQFVPEQSVLLGDAALASLGLWKFDLAIFSGQGMDQRGIWNAPQEIVRIEQAALKHSRRGLALLDKSKLGIRPGFFLTKWQEKLALLTNATARELSKHGIPESVLG